MNQTLDFKSVLSLTDGFNQDILYLKAQIAKNAVSSELELAYALSLWSLLSGLDSSILEKVKLLSLTIQQAAQSIPDESHIE